MFTGIVEAVGEIKRITPLEKGVSLRIASGSLDLTDIKAGDSIAVNGVCLTATAFENDAFSVDVSRETLNCTAGLDKQGGRVNLEKALRLSGRLDGHLVSGHVDGVGEVVRFEQAGESYLLAIKAPHP
ncbi:MAG TPA: riboflavin synthase, partial [Nitrosospira sp.]